MNKENNWKWRLDSIREILEHEYKEKFNNEAFETFGHIFEDELNKEKNVEIVELGSGREFPEDNKIRDKYIDFEKGDEENLILRDEKGNWIGTHTLEKVVREKLEKAKINPDEFSVHDWLEEIANIG